MGENTSEVTVGFGIAAQSLAALQAAAYRFIGTASCQIDQRSSQWICRLTPVSHPGKHKCLDTEGLKAQFLDLVTDENLRERIAARTDGVRNVILALAFGSLANSENNHT